jgi:hypothetical protein
MFRLQFVSVLSPVGVGLWCRPLVEVGFGAFFFRPRSFSVDQPIPDLVPGGTNGPGLEFGTAH